MQDSTSWRDSLRRPPTPTPEIVQQSIKKETLSDYSWFNRKAFTRGAVDLTVKFIGSCVAGWGIIGFLVNNFD